MKAAFTRNLFIQSIGIMILFPITIYSQQPELVVPVGHTSSFGKLYFSPDGSKIATTAFKDHMIAVWDVKTGKLLTTFMDGSAYWGFDKIYFSPDGKKLLSYARDETTPMVWDVEMKKLLKAPDPDENYDPEEYFPDSVLNPEPGEEVLINGTVISIPGGGGPGKNIVKIDCKTVPEDVILSDDGNKLAVALSDVIRIYNVNSGMVLREWSWHGHIPDYSITISPDGKRIITYGSYLNIWDGETGNMLNSKFMGYNEQQFENPASIRFAAACDTFIAIKKGNWQIWDAVNAKLITGSKKIFNGALKGALSNDGQYAIIIYQNKTDGFAELYDFRHIKNIKKFILGTSPVEDVSFSPDNMRFFISYEKKKNTEIRMANTFTLIKTIPGIMGGNFNQDGTKMITSTGDYNVIDDIDTRVSYIWNINSFSLLGRVSGIASFNPVEDEIVTSFGYIFNPDQPGFEKKPDSLDDYSSIGSLDPPFFSSDGRKIIAIQPNNGTAGYPDGVYMWDKSSRKLIMPDTADIGFNIVSASGKKRLTVFVDGDDDMKIIDPEKKDTISLANSRDFVWSNYAEFSPDDQFVNTSNDQTIKKWETSTGRLLYTFFPVDSTAFLTRIPSGYYTCGPDAAKALHYLKGLQVINFTQLDIRYNRPDKVLEYINYPDTALISAYRNVYVKRIRKLGIDTSYFQDDYAVPEADFTNRENIRDEQKGENLVLHIRATDSTYILDHFNIWFNGVPLYGLKGLNILPAKTKYFDTTITISLTQGENKIETSVTNVNGIESFRTPLFVKYIPETPRKETTYFIGIGIKNFSETGHNLRYSVKDIRNLAVSLKRKGGENFMIIDTLFDENVTVNKIRDLKIKIQQTGINDKVIIAYSGHGLLSKDFDYYLSTYDVNFSKPEINGLLYDELENLLDSIPARKKLMLIDACFSGEVDKEELRMLELVKKELGDTSSKGGETIVDTANRRLGIKNSVELMQQLFANVGKSTGAVIIAASAGTQLARESGGLKNSVFTYCVLEAMKQYPEMYAGRLNQVVSRRVIELSHGLQKSTLRNEQKDIDWKLW